MLHCQPSGVTDAFHSSFWFLDGLGVLAQRGHHTFCRQTLVGGRSAPPPPPPPAGSNPRTRRAESGGCSATATARPRAPRPRRSYGLLDTATLAPNPDLYALLLWRRLMGAKVLGARAQTPGGGALSHLRAYAAYPATTTSTATTTATATSSTTTPQRHVCIHLAG